jgi:hypothetical protein
MKKYILLSALVMIMGVLQSCLKRGLQDLPAFTDANIDRFDFEYRWNDNGTFRVVRFNTDAPVANGKTLTVKTTVPDASGAFTSAIRDKVTAAAIVGMCNVSTAATIKPVNGAPGLGVPGDFSKPVSYEVTAADGKTSNVWTVNITFVK